MGYEFPDGQLQALRQYAATHPQRDDSLEHLCEALEYLRAVELAARRLFAEDETEQLEALRELYSYVGPPEDEDNADSPPAE